MKTQSIEPFSIIYETIPKFFYYYNAGEGAFCVYKAPVFSGNCTTPYNLGGKCEKDPFELHTQVYSGTIVYEASIKMHEYPENYLRLADFAYHKHKCTYFILPRMWLMPECLYGITYIKDEKVLILLPVITLDQMIKIL